MRTRLRFLWVSAAALCHGSYNSALNARLVSLYTDHFLCSHRLSVSLNKTHSIPQRFAFSVRNLAEEKVCIE